MDYDTAVLNNPILIVDHPSPSVELQLKVLQKYPEAIALLKNPNPDALAEVCRRMQLTEKRLAARVLTYYGSYITPEHWSLKYVTDLVPSNGLLIKYVKNPSERLRSMAIAAMPGYRGKLKPDINRPGYWSF